MHYRIKELKFKQLRHWVSYPFIFGVAIPFVFVDLGVEIYHRICFPLYGIPYVRRSKYIKIDRHKLSYLGTMQKVGCVYCGYVNGLIPYMEAIAGNTENYWCGIKHNYKKSDYIQDHHQSFTEYNNKEDYNKKYTK